MKTTQTSTSRPHDEAVVAMLKADPAFADEYLAVALEKAGEFGGQSALLAALRHISEAQGMAAVIDQGVACPDLLSAAKGSTALE